MRMRRNIFSILVAAMLICCATMPTGRAHQFVKTARTPDASSIASRQGMLDADRAGVELVADPATGVAIGDVLQVSVFGPEAGFVPGEFVTLPSLRVDCNGIISVPHAGQIRAAGRTLDEIRREIEARLAARVIEPRVTVTLLASRSRVFGECAAARRS